jgi:hypothetical protein
VESSRRTYFLLLALASGCGWLFGLWAVPLVAFVMLETAWTIAEWVYDRGFGASPRALSRRRSVT